MQSHGYEHSAAWKQSLALLDRVRAAAEGFENDDCGLAGRLRAIASDMPVLVATTFEQVDYDAAQSHADTGSQQLFKLAVQARVARHLGLLTPKQFNALYKQIDALDALLSELPDELFEDDGVEETRDAA